LIVTYDGKPSYTVSIMEFKDDKVARETQYFADPQVVSQILRSAHPQHDVQARQPASQPQQIPVNEAEWILREMFDCAGLDGYQP
jgi:hypothetical protein